MTSKICHICKETKLFTDFNKAAKAKDGLQHYCRACSNAKRKQWDLEDPERTRGKWLKDAYGISLADYNRMLDEQDHKCAICKQDETRFKKKLVVDHCHETGKVIQLLCNMCNHVLGNFKDDITLFAEAIKYITKHNMEKKNK